MGARYPLMFCGSMRAQKNIPDNLKKLAKTLIRETGERKNGDLREVIGVAAPLPPLVAAR